MSSTVTTTTTSVAALGAGPLLGFMLVLALLALLFLREMASGGDVRWKRLSRSLMVAIAPLLAVFSAIVISRLVAIL